MREDVEGSGERGHIGGSGRSEHIVGSMEREHIAASFEGEHRLVKVEEQNDSCDESSALMVELEEKRLICPARSPDKSGHGTQA